ncbi:YcxB family protein [Asticcacaulis sp. BYS171W]|uniref:YcxB family protein n=1 Tax=Asticcacaulis aquaticus TaxID=2984212 RepID=A0ABT5HRK9_9CAUL|nr:YcxB family protein [Asticcacaulis aquaticus]MDC7682694.1 YcxB family protein [Asticcacaulis aquaticus]
MSEWEMSTQPYRLTMSDFRSYRWANLKANALTWRGLWELWKYVILSLLFCRFLIWFIVDALGQTLTADKIAFAVLIPVLAVLLLAWHTYDTKTLMLAKSDYSATDCLTRIGTEGVIVVHPHGDSSRIWSEFSRIAYEGNLILFYMPGELGVVVPRQAFVTERQRRVFYDLANRYLSAAKMNAQTKA